MEDSNLTFSPNESLFKGETGDWRNTTFTPGVTSNLVPYAVGFRDAGDLLVDRSIEQRRRISSPSPHSTATAMTSS